MTDSEIRACIIRVEATMGMVRFPGTSGAPVKAHRQFKQNLAASNSYRSGGSAMCNVNL